MIRPSASKAMLMHNASKKTPLMSAPRISARCQPYEFALDEGAWANLMAYSATIRERISLQVSIGYGFMMIECIDRAETHLSIWKESATRASDPTM